MNNELNQVAERYEKRKNDSQIQMRGANIYFSHFVTCERELKYKEIIRSRFKDTSSLKMLEVGAGTGGNLCFFKKAGFQWKNMFANELLPDRFKVLSENYPQVNTFSGDASELDLTDGEGFDIIFQSTVFTSILDDEFKKKIASNLWRLLKPGGIILWYDFVYNNPNNKDVKGIPINEVKQLFPEHQKFTYSRVTLAPPIGRRIKKWYPLFNIFPFLKTHIVAEIVK